MSKGVVDTNTRKQQLISRLALLPHVHSSILSVEEIGSRPLTRSAFRKGQPFQTYSVEGQPSPLEQYLRENTRSLDQLGVISQSSLHGSLRIQQADFHLSELRERFKDANQLPADQQNLLMALSRKYIDVIQTALDGNEHTLFSIGLGSSEQSASLPHASSAGEVLDEQVSRYQELCQQLITGGAGESVSAVIIAAQLGDSGALIRAGSNQIQVAAPAPHN